jgi:putative flippase GtrA
MTIIKQFTGRDAGPVIQFIKYGIAGGIATLTHIVIFHLFAWKLFPALQENDSAVKYLHLSVARLDDATRSFNSMLDNFAAFMLSNLVAYLLNGAWVFKRGRHSLPVEIALFYLVSGISMAIGTALMGFLIREFGIRTTYAFFTNVATAVMINYAVRKFFIFKG